LFRLARSTTRTPTQPTPTKAGFIVRLGSAQGGVRFHVGNMTCIYPLLALWCYAMAGPARGGGAPVWHSVGFCAEGRWSFSVMIDFPATTAPGNHWRQKVLAMARNCKTYVRQQLQQQQQQQ
jgi:hypothetical protein